MWELKVSSLRWRVRSERSKANRFPVCATFNSSCNSFVSKSSVSIVEFGYLFGLYFNHLSLRVMINRNETAIFMLIVVQLNKFFGV